MGGGRYKREVNNMTIKQQVNRITSNIITEMINGNILGALEVASKEQEFICLLYDMKYIELESRDELIIQIDNAIQKGNRILDSRKDR